MAPHSQPGGEPSPIRGMLVAGTSGLVAVLALGALARTVFALDVLFPIRAAAVFAGILLIAARYVSVYHPHSRFGAANYVSTVRAAITSLMAALIGDAGSESALAWAAAATALAAALDGVDGWLARRSRLASAFGARFDMEVDALIILVLSALAWRHEKAGAWILIAGVLRYLFIAAGWIWRWMKQPLPPSRRRQTACIVQILGLVLVIHPSVPPSVSVWIAAATLAFLAWSFLDDVEWLWRRRNSGTGHDDGPAKAGHDDSPAKAGHYVRTLGALLLLNASLTFHNIWPTPWIIWRGEWSLELALCLLLVAALTRRGRHVARTFITGVTIGWCLLAVWRYVDVTAPALFGRDLNLFWDSRYIPDVMSMFAHAVPAWLSVPAVLVFLGAAVVALLAVRWALSAIASAMTENGSRRVLVGVAAAACVAFLGQQVFTAVPRVPGFATPVSVSAARQARLVLDSIAGTHSPAPSPPIDSDLSLVDGADVLLVFVESYGSVVYDRPDFARALTAGRAAVTSAIHDTNRTVVSAFAESPTFGGSSWLAHISFLSGVEVRDPDTNARLMAEQRDTMVTTFSRKGYRTVALMPGLWYPWPEGSFYRFDDIYNGERFDYRGPEFGWWSMSDQYVLAAVKALELDKTARPPVFVFFPTITTHAPFSPTPPYQADWDRMLTPAPYDASDLARTSEDYADWLDLSPGYVRSVSYFYATLAGFLRETRDRDMVLIVMGDHQPAAAVTGEGAPWDVPVHVIASRPAVLDRLVERGFRRGLDPSRPVLGPMHTLLPLMLDAFGQRSTPGAVIPNS